MLKRTPLFEEHLRLGAKIVEFAGWQMPVEYSGLRHEHLNTRENVGLFDVSHMGEIRFRGENSLATLQWLTTNDVSRLQSGDAQYSLLSNFEGGLVDDTIVYCIQPSEDYLICVNAANTQKDFAWVSENNRGAEITDESSEWGQIAVQGPKAMALVSRLFGDTVQRMKPFQFQRLAFAGDECLVARTGYTGEDGVEIFVASHATADLWRVLLERGQDLGAQPVGLGARDTLRTEMKYSLYGHEIDETTNPYSAGLGWVLKPETKEFIGRTVILAAKERGLPETLVGFEMVDKGIARAGYKIFDAHGEVIGRVTSGTPSPSTGKNIGIAYVKTLHGKIGSEIAVDIRGRHSRAVVVKTPFVQTKRRSE